MPEVLQIKLDYKPHKFQQQFHKSQKMIRLMSSGIRGGKCGNFEVVMANGEIKHVKDIKLNDEVLSFNDVSLKLGSSKVSNIFDTGRKRCLRLTTKTGRTIDVTPDHKFFTRRGWEKTSRLVVDKDYIALPRKLEVKTNLVYDIKRLKLLAYLIADGNVSQRHTAIITKKDNFVVDEIKTLVPAGHNIAVIRNSKGYDYRIHGRKNGKGFTNEILIWLREIGLSGKRSHQKVIPDFVFQLDNKQIAVFLSRLFDCDGWVDKRSVGYCSTSKRLILQIAHLLLRFGIVTRYRKKIPKLNGKICRDAFELTIQNYTDLIVYNKEIGLFSKQDKLDKLMVKLKEVFKHPKKLDVIPEVTVKRFFDSLDRSDPKHKEKWNKLRNTYCRKKIGRMMRWRMQEIAELFDDDEFRTLGNSDIYWDPVIKIEPIGLKDTWDFEVENNHSYIANDIITHNSIGLVMEAIKLAHAGWKSFGVPNEGCIVSPTYCMQRDILLPIFDSVMVKAEEQSGFKLVAKFNKNEMICNFANGSKILFRSAEFPDRLRGPKFQWFALDEPREMKKEIYPVMHGRIADSDGCGFLATTTKGHDWVYDNIIKPYNEKTDQDIDVIRWSSYDNPYFPKHRIDKLKQLYSEEFFKQEIMADIIAIKGVVYKDFSRFTHVKDFTFDNMKYFIAGVDFGYNQPAILLIGFDSDGAAYVCDEWYESEKLTSDIIGVLKSWQQQYKLDVVLCDPADPGAIKELQDAGLPAVAAENAVAVGINKVSEYLRPGRLTIHAQCLNLIKEIEVYHYREGTDAPVKVYDHACFPAGTMITLNGGDKPIEEVRVGDMALTRKGYRKVLVSGMTSEHRRIIKIELGDGKILKCTLDHPIFVTGYHDESEHFKTACTLYHDELVHLIKGKARVQSMTILEKSQSVFNLTVEDEHEYYANGILVSNCDALRYSLVGAKKEQEFKQPDYVVSW
jgi:intein/homing endonuclease